MVQNDLDDKDKIILNSYIQFGTYSIYFLGTVIATHIYDYLKNKETNSAEA